MIVVMGSGGETVARDRRVPRRRAASESASLQVRLYRPFPAARARRSAAGDRPRDRRARPHQGAGVARRAAVPRRASRRSARRMRDGRARAMPRVIGGRYGLSSKEFTPAMVAGVFEELAGERAATTVHGRHQRRRLRHQPGATTPRSTSSPPRRCAQCSSASARTGRSARTRTRSRSSATRRPARPGLLRLRLQEVGLADRLASALRAAADPRALSDLRRRTSSAATSSGCSSAPRCSIARPPGATLLLNCPAGPDEVWDALSRPVQEQILAKRIELYVIDARRIAREVGLAGRINTVLQTCFFAISGVLPREQAIERIKAVDRQDLRHGAARRSWTQNQAAVDQALAGLHRVEVPDAGHAPRASRPRSCPRTRRSSCAP